MSSLRNFNLNVPTIWKKNWQEAIESSEGSAKTIILYQARAASLLKLINDRESMPERIAWLTIWTRTFAILDGILGALERSNLVILQVMDRMAFECLMHAEIILEPVAKLWNAKKKGVNVIVSDSFEVRAWQQVRQRLQAYTAWCLWNDRFYYTELLDYRTLYHIWDPAPGLRARTAKKQIPDYEILFGPTEIETDPDKICEGKRQMEAMLQLRLARCDDWLTDSRMVTWKMKLDSLQKANNKSVSFIQLIQNDTKKSISRRLQDVERRFMYVEYMMGSMILHGSTIEHILKIGEDFLYPCIIGTADDCEQMALKVGSSCNNTVLFLAMFQKILWNS